MTDSISKYARCLDIRRRWDSVIVRGPAGVFALENGARGWTVHRILTDEHTTRPTGPPFTSYSEATAKAKEYATDYNPRAKTDEKPFELS